MLVILSVGYIAYYCFNLIHVLVCILAGDACKGISTTAPLGCGTGGNSYFQCDGAVVQDNPCDPNGLLTCKPANPNVC